MITSIARDSSRHEAKREETPNTVPVSVCLPTLGLMVVAYGYYTVYTCINTFETG